MNDVLSALDRSAASWFADQLTAATADAPPARPSQVALVERSAAAGQMAPLARRDEDEAYRVLEGRVTFHVDDYEVAAEAGDVVVAPAGVARTFRVESESARWMVLTRVSSLERFVDFGRAVSAAAADPAGGWPSPAERQTLGAMAAANGIELLGPPGALPRRAAATAS